MLKKIQTQIQTRVDAEIAAVVPALAWKLIKASVTIERSTDSPVFNVIFSPEDVKKPADNAAQALKAKWAKFETAQADAQSMVHAIIFKLATFAKDTFKLTNDAGAGLVFDKINPISSVDYGGFSVILQPKDLTKELYDELSQ